MKGSDLSSLGAAAAIAEAWSSIFVFKSLCNLSSCSDTADPIPDDKLPIEVPSAGPVAGATPDNGSVSFIKLSNLVLLEILE